MANDRQVIAYLSPAELVALMNQTGILTVQESTVSDGKPVIHAALKVVNAENGEHLPGGLPFSVVMFKGASEPGYSNIAIGTIVPAAELRLSLSRDYFNFCNQRYRFTRCFPIDDRSFVIQMDLVVKNATREYVKFGFGLWGALFSQMLFELMGRGRESLIAVAEAYAAVPTDFAGQMAVPVADDTVMPLAAAAIVPEADVAPAAEAVAEAVVEPPVEPVAEPVAEAAEEIPVPSEHTEITADPVEGKEMEDPPSELSIAAGPQGDPLAENQDAPQTEHSNAAAPLAEAVADVAVGTDLPAEGPAASAEGEGAGLQP